LHEVMAAALEIGNDFGANPLFDADCVTGIDPPARRV
jgi:hypothetical protein